MVATSSPSTALSTEIAGVMAPSPYSSAAPAMPNKRSMDLRRAVALAVALPSPANSGDVVAPVNASSAKMPPSPPLSARIITVRYLPLTTMINDQTNSDRIPSTFACVTATGCEPTNVSWSA